MMDFEGKKYEEKVLKVLPTDRKYFFEYINFREDANHAEEIKFYTIFRVYDVKSKNEMKEFIRDFGKTSKTTWNMTNEADQENSYKYHGKRKCHHRVRVHDKQDNNHLRKDGKPSGTGKIKDFGKQTLCDTDLRFALQKCGSRCTQKKDTPEHDIKLNYPVLVKFNYIHNHPIICADALRFRKVDPKVEETVQKLLDENLAPSAVHQRLIESLDNSDHVADRSELPDYKWVLNVYQKYKQVRFGTSNGPDVVSKKHSLIVTDDSQSSHHVKNARSRVSSASRRSCRWWRGRRAGL